MAKMGEEIKNLIVVWTSVIFCLCYCHWISSRLPKGLWRLLSFLPIVCIFTVLPLYQTSAFLAAVTAFFITWLANFKLFLYAFDQGPLSSGSDPAVSLAIFLVIAIFPSKVKSTTDVPKARKTRKLPINLATEIPVCVLLLFLFGDQKESLHPIILLVLYCCSVFFLVDILVALSSLLVQATVGLEVEPPSDEPYFAASLQEFWGRRWNVSVSSILRQAVFKPVRSAATAMVGADWAALPAVLAAFLVSGLMHELLFWYVTRVRPSWETTAFFMVQGVSVVVEFGLRVELERKKWHLPWLVRCPLTVGFVAATSFWLFFPPLIRNGADVKVIQEFQLVMESVMKMVRVLWSEMGRQSL